MLESSFLFQLFEDEFRISILEPLADMSLDDAIYFDRKTQIRGGLQSMDEDIDPAVGLLKASIVCSESGWIRGTWNKSNRLVSFVQSNPGESIDYAAVPKARS